MFVGVIVYTHLQRHRRITASESEQGRFVEAKKALAVALLIAFVVAGVEDLWRVAAQDDPYPFFDELLHGAHLRRRPRRADLAALYRHVRRGLPERGIRARDGRSSRLALVAPPTVNVLLGLGATAFVHRPHGGLQSRTDRGAPLPTDPARLGAEADLPTG